MCYKRWDSTYCLLRILRATEQNDAHCALRGGRGSIDVEEKKTRERHLFILSLQEGPWARVVLSSRSPIEHITTGTTAAMPSSSYDEGSLASSVYTFSEDESASSRSESERRRSCAHKDKDKNNCLVSKARHHLTSFPNGA
jgi:hypothetical protein